MNKNSWKITKEQYNKLLYYVGCGNFPKADIIIFGNEEGTGGYGIEENVEARFNLYGKNKQGEYEFSLSGKNYQSGYWEPSSRGGRDKIISYLTNQGGISKTSEFTKGYFLPAVARICLALEHSEKESHYWFKSYTQNPEAEKKIKKYILESIFCEKEGIQTALMDWRHLPRPNERVWPEEYKDIADGLGGNKYLKAYSLPKRNNNLANSFSNFSEDVTIRKNVLKNILEAIPAKIIIGFGNIPIKRKALNQILDPIKFEPLILNDIKIGVQAEKDVSGRKKYVFLLPFPSPQTYGSNERLLESLEKFTYKLRTLLNQ